MKQRKKREEVGEPNYSARRQASENAAAAGLLLIAIGLVSPFVGFTSPGWMTAFKWVYAAGAVIFFAARFTASLWRDEPMKIRRLRRMESWAGVAFAIGAFFWIRNTSGFEGLPSFRMLGETIAFTMAGAAIQLIATWRLSAELKKTEAAKSDKKSGRNQSNE